MEGQESGKSCDRELDEILSAYADILNEDGAGSSRELAYLEKYTHDPEVLKLLRGARAVKAFFEAYGDFPDLEQGMGPEGRF